LIRDATRFRNLLLLIDCATMGLFGNLKEKLVRRRAIARKGDKDALTVTSTSEETYSFEPSSHTTEVYRLFSEESLSSSPRHNTTTTTTAGSRVMNFFDGNKTSKYSENDRDDLHLLPELTSLGRRSEGSDTDDEFDADEDKENERDNVRLLSLGSKENRACRFAYEFDEYKEELIFEPSFEVALMDPDHFEKMMNDSANTETMSLGNTLNGSKNAPAYDDKSHLEPILLPICRPLPQKRYDHNGNPFLHIFHDELSTLYEESSCMSDGEGDNFYTVTVSECPRPLFDDDKDTENQLPTRTEVIPKRREPEDFSDDDKLRARWDHALALMRNGNNTREFDGIEGIVFSSHSSKNYRTAYEI
jgi:hypothetical protein